jgi:hypothetical protein
MPEEMSSNDSMLRFGVFSYRVYIYGRCILEFKQNSLSTILITFIPLQVCSDRYMHFPTPRKSFVSIQCLLWPLQSRNPSSAEFNGIIVTIERYLKRIVAKCWIQQCYHFIHGRLRNLSFDDLRLQISLNSVSYFPKG